LSYFFGGSKFLVLTFTPGLCHSLVRALGAWKVAHSAGVRIREGRQGDVKIDLPEPVYEYQ